MVDDQQFEYYDSITRRAQVKLDWLVKYIADKDPQYLDRHTQIFMGTQPNYKPNIEILKTRFNQTGGLFMFDYWLQKCFLFLHHIFHFTLNHLLYDKVIIV